MTEWIDLEPDDPLLKKAIASSKASVDGDEEGWEPAGPGDDLYEKALARQRWASGDAPGWTVWGMMQGIGGGAEFALEMLSGLVGSMYGTPKGVWAGWTDMQLGKHPDSGGIPGGEAFQREFEKAADAATYPWKIINDGEFATKKGERLSGQIQDWYVDYIDEGWGYYIGDKVSDGTISPAVGAILRPLPDAVIMVGFPGLGRALKRRLSKKSNKDDPRINIDEDPSGGDGSGGVPRKTGRVVEGEYIPAGGRRDVAASEGSRGRTDTPVFNWPDALEGPRMSAERQHFVRLLEQGKSVDEIQARTSWVETPEQLSLALESMRTEKPVTPSVSKPSHIQNGIDYFGNINLYNEMIMKELTLWDKAIPKILEKQSAGYLKRNFNPPGFMTDKSMIIKWVMQNKEPNSLRLRQRIADIGRFHKMEDAAHRLPELSAKEYGELLQKVVEYDPALAARANLFVPRTVRERTLRNQKRNELDKLDSELLEIIQESAQFWADKRKLPAVRGLAERIGVDPKGSKRQVAARIREQAARVRKEISRELDARERMNADLLRPRKNEPMAEPAGMEPQALDSVIDKIQTTPNSRLMSEKTKTLFSWAEELGIDNYTGLNRKDLVSELKKKSESGSIGRSKKPKKKSDKEVLEDLWKEENKKLDGPTKFDLADEVFNSSLDKMLRKTKPDLIKMAKDMGVNFRERIPEKLVKQDIVALISKQAKKLDFERNAGKDPYYRKINKGPGGKQSGAIDPNAIRDGLKIIYGRAANALYHPIQTAFAVTNIIGKNLMQKHISLMRDLPSVTAKKLAEMIFPELVSHYVPKSILQRADLAHSILFNNIIRPQTPINILKQIHKDINAPKLDLAGLSDAAASKRLSISIKRQAAHIIETIQLKDDLSAIQKSPGFYEKVDLQVGQFMKRFDEILDPLRTSFSGKGNRDAAAGLRWSAIPKEIELEIIRGLETGNVRASLAPTVRALREVFDDFHKYLVDAGVFKPGDGYVQGFWPHMWALRPGDKVQLREFRTFLEVKERIQDPSLIARMINRIKMDDGLFEFIEDASGGWGTWTGTHKGPRRVAGIEGRASSPFMSRQRFLDGTSMEAKKFQITDIEAVVNAYVTRGVRKAEYTRLFGKQEHKLNRYVKDIINEVKADAQYSGKVMSHTPESIARTIYEIADVMQNRYNEIPYPAMRTASHTLAAFEVTKSLGLVFFAQAPEFLVPAYRWGFTQTSKHLVGTPLEGVKLPGKSYFKGTLTMVHDFLSEASKLPTGQRIIPKPEMRAALELINAAGARASESAALRYTGGGGPLASKFLKTVGMDFATRWQQFITYDTIKSVIRNDARILASEVEGSPKYRQAFAEIEGMGIDPLIAKDWYSRGMPTDHPINGPELWALSRTISRTIIDPKGANIPRWLNSKKNQLIFLFQRFFSTFGNTVATDMAKLSKHPDYMARRKIGAIPSMMASVGIAYYIQFFREGLSGYSIRDADDWMRVIDAFDRAGFFGGFSRFYPIVSPYKYMAGHYAVTSMLGPFFGGTMPDVVSGAKAGFSGEPRALAREIAANTPIMTIHGETQEWWEDVVYEALINLGIDEDTKWE